MNIGAGIKSLAGGEVPVLTKNLENCRSTAIDRMVGMAKEKGADAVSGVRFGSLNSVITDTEDRLSDHGMAI